MGEGGIFLRGQWVGVAPGDLAFVPAGARRGIRNPAGNAADFVPVNQIAPPQFDLYEAGGFYDREHGVMQFDAIDAAKREAGRADLKPATDAAFRDTHPEVRPWNLSVQEIRRDGAPFNVFKGARFGGLGTPMLPVLWPGYGARPDGRRDMRVKVSPEGPG